jgi:hypothetical protein
MARRVVCLIEHIDFDSDMYAVDQMNPQSGRRASQLLMRAAFGSSRCTRGVLNRGPHLLPGGRAWRICENPALTSPATER